MDSKCLCPRGWVTHGHHCYLYVPQPESFNTAESLCVARGLPGRPSHLASVLDEAEASFLADLIKRSGSTPHAWIGLLDIALEGYWSWLDGSPLSSTQWGPGQPDNSGNEDCVFLRTDSTWNDYVCESSVVYICKMLQRYRSL
ncbi:alpha-N-acetylgalactosamine-specific lectin-like [Acanthaster planci]|uniref:Alpha-N-acetylgalactosamine-specific lectin-like n=1 Tax=Acanthaster planci TaxID=133434 RepID=A0A8B7YKJ7_ACAPL|nr:alpha-N-acetylgalactosamine-specific lectin-like [Acanthaster planci]